MRLGCSVFSYVRVSLLKFKAQNKDHFSCAAYTVNDVPGKDPLKDPPKVVYRDLMGLSFGLH